MRNRIAVVLLLLVLAGCATSEDAQSPAAASPMSNESPTTQPSGVATVQPAPGGSELTGFLGADPIEGGCAYLETEDGTRYEVIYPPGYDIDRSDATLRDPTGAVIATAGDVVTVRGREAKDMVSFCQIGPIFQATEVVSVE
jgi:hypothetical protein